MLQLSRLALCASSIALVAALTGCGDDGDSNNTGGSGPVGAGGSTGGAPSGGTGGATGGGTTGGTGGTPVTPTLTTISGEITWNVAFDADALAAGATDCSYTRTYEGVEDASVPWLCPDCEIIFRTDVELTAGLDDCYSQISNFTPAIQEYLGYGNGVWYRSPGGPMSDQGTVTLQNDSATTENLVADLEFPAGGTFGFDVQGSFTFAEADGDPNNGFAVSDTYSCGWEKADAPAYTGDYGLAMGAEVPDGLFYDQCGDTVRLHDFKGKYLMIDMSAADCPPCQAMASQEPQFIADMAAQGIEVEVITLLAPSLSNVFGETTVSLLNTWVNNFNIESPVLADRAWGQSMFQPVFGQAGAYPSWVLVDPDLIVFGYGEGLSANATGTTGAFDDMAAQIIAHQSGN